MLFFCADSTMTLFKDRIPNLGKVWQRRRNKEKAWGVKAGRTESILLWMTWNPKGSQTETSVVQLIQIILILLRYVIFFSVISFLLYWISRLGWGGEASFGNCCNRVFPWLLISLSLRHFSEQILPCQQFQFLWIGISQWVKKNGWDKALPKSFNSTRVFSEVHLGRNNGSAPKSFKSGTTLLWERQANKTFHEEEVWFDLTWFDLTWFDL